MVLCAFGPGDGSRFLFQVNSEYYKQRSVIFTTNLKFIMWVDILSDEQMMVAMIDQRAYHSYLPLFESESYRIRNLLMKDYDT